jgi:hypothetical protein
MAEYESDAPRGSLLGAIADCRSATFVKRPDR